ncbi:putative iron utilization protein [Corynebacterium renale]|uniref:siderophore-interacting protein n=1 Tax=Corynebacterium renale TaxID=1724 RepID=UPI000DA3CB58|nr:siderophore-interacting protein [Corynebacterium renale]SQG65155.1 putative iron utilization protein [Corynebacterium renale]STC98100.1 putative iron utilization protein [Corynebacterium renale]
MSPHALHPITLVSNVQLQPRLHRLTFTSEHFADYPLTGPDEFFGLVMPKKGTEFQPFEVDGINIRAAVAAMPEHTRPDLRWYTIRRFDHGARRMDVDVVTHGDSGPGSRWIRQAKPGDVAGMFTCNALWVPPTDSQLLVADASALPALRHILEYQEANAPHALEETLVTAVVTAHEEVEQGLVDRWADKVAGFNVVETSKTLEAAAVADFLRQQYSHQIPRSVWVSGEGDLTKSVRRVAVKEWGLDPKDVIWVPFWFHGRARP